MNRKLIIFDLDGTLTKSKAPIESQMVRILCNLLGKGQVVVIGGGSDKQFFNQFISHLDCAPGLLKNLYIMPTSGARLYVYDDGWNESYANDLFAEEKNRILNAFEKTFKNIKYVPPPKIYGQAIEDRKSQISFSATGQEAPLEVKAKWDPDRKKRAPIVEKLKEYLPEFDIKMGGTNTIDITKKGINKAYGVREITRRLGYRIEDAIYIGDALYENGNDAIVKETGIDTIQVSGPEETIWTLKKLNLT